MTVVALSFTPQISAVAYTDQEGRSWTIARGRTEPYGRTTFRTKVDPGRCFYIHRHHYFPRSAVEAHDRALRIPFCIKDDTLTMYLEARMAENRKVYDLRCPLNLTWVNASRLGTLSGVSGSLRKETRTEASQEVESQPARPAGLPFPSLPVKGPFRKQAVTAVGRVMVEGMLTLAEGQKGITGSVAITFESLIDKSFVSFPFPGVLVCEDCSSYGWSDHRPPPIVSSSDGLSIWTPELATAEGIMKISPLRVDNIYICINSGMWRIHLGEETVDGLGREVVLPLVDVDDPFDPLD
ncbi:hypothetical protein FOZ61_003616 [Perkinsus olseni]|uniref:Uncharacterized protein n=1 Tax=Perkinsus olseni TaxID=32597 RepID=A0A7J6LNY7_PEROL|nr:hypothetical protein FOZ61_003616 [Perkinsus olseni]KAF4667180.1 hypothetical protein FOL46_002642 [Perkinsus olseni]